MTDLPDLTRCTGVIRDGGGAGAGMAPGRFAGSFKIETDDGPMIGIIIKGGDGSKPDGSQGDPGFLCIVGDNGASGLSKTGADASLASVIYGDGPKPLMGLATLMSPEERAAFDRSIMDEEPEPYALTERRVAALEKAIRAEGYVIACDPETGAIELLKARQEGKA